MQVACLAGFQMLLTLLCDKHSLAKAVQLRRSNNIEGVAHQQ